MAKGQANPQPFGCAEALPVPQRWHRRTRFATLVANRLNDGGRSRVQPCPMTMHVLSRRLLPAVLLSALLAAPAAEAARVAVLSNRFSTEVANDFNAKIPAHSFTAFDVSGGPPSLDALLKFDEVLLFEDQVFDQSTAVGNRVHDFVAAGRPVVLGTFYEQDRSDRRVTPSLSVPPHGWGRLEIIDPNTTDGIGAASTLRTLADGSIVDHPLTVGVATLAAPAGFGGGNEAKPGTQVVAHWSQSNANNRPDPAIAYRYVVGIGPATCIIHLGIAPDLIYWAPGGATPVYYQAWRNAFDYASGNCGIGWHVPATSPAGLAALALALAASAAWLARRRRARA